MKNERRSLYRVLHVQPEAPAAIIAAAYRCLMTKLRHHPDLGAIGQPRSARQHRDRQPLVVTSTQGLVFGRSPHQHRAELVEEIGALVEDRLALGSARQAHRNSLRPARDVAPGVFGDRLQGRGRIQPEDEDLVLVDRLAALPRQRLAYRRPAGAETIGGSGNAGTGQIGDPGP